MVVAAVVEVDLDIRFVCSAQHSTTYLLLLAQALAVAAEEEVGVEAVEPLKVEELVL